MSKASSIVLLFSLHGFHNSGLCKVELICWAGKARLTGLFETYEDFPQKVKYVSFSGLIAEVIARAVYGTHRTGPAGCLQRLARVYLRQLFPGMGR